MEIRPALGADALGAGDPARGLEGSSPAKAAAKFEEMFAALLVKEMRKALPEGFFGDGSDGDIYGGWLDEHLGRAIARRGSLGIAELVERGLVEKQAARGGGPS